MLKETKTKEGSSRGKNSFVHFHTTKKKKKKNIRKHDPFIADQTAPV